MQHGVPCISTTEGGVPGIIDDGKTGFVVEKQSSTLLAAKMELLLKDIPLRKEMGTTGRLKFEREFTLHKFEERMAEILSLCSGND